MLSKTVLLRPSLIRTIVMIVSFVLTVFVSLQFRAMKATAKLLKLLIVTQILAKDRCLEVSKILCKIDPLDGSPSGGL